MKLLPILLLLTGLSACHTTRELPALADGTTLPQNNGYIVYSYIDTLSGIAMPEINRVAQAWINQHTREYSFEWQPPIYKAELMYAGQIQAEQIKANTSDYYTRRKVTYFLTVSAKDGQCRLLLTNFSVEDGRRAIGLEKLTGDQDLCKSVDREATSILRSMSASICKHTNKPL